MREIKFRAWSESSCGYEYIEDLYWFEENFVHDISGNVVYDKYVFEQFTGIRDRTGKEIYEGDIIKLIYIHDEGGGWKSNSKEIGKVYFDKNWGVKFDCVDFSQRLAECHWKLEKSKFQDATDVLIIGNIHETPELLRKKP